MPDAPSSQSTMGDAYGWQISLDQFPRHQTWTWHAYGPQGSRSGFTYSESEAIKLAKAAANELRRPTLRTVG